MYNYVLHTGHTKTRTVNIPLPKKVEAILRYPHKRTNAKKTFLRHGESTPYHSTMIVSVQVTIMSPNKYKRTGQKYAKTIPLKTEAKSTVLTMMAVVTTASYPFISKGSGINVVQL